MMDFEVDFESRRLEKNFLSPLIFGGGPDERRMDSKEFSNRIEDTIRASIDFEVESSERSPILSPFTITSFQVVV